MVWLVFVNAIVTDLLNVGSSSPKLRFMNANEPVPQLEPVQPLQFPALQLAESSVFVPLHIVKLSGCVIVIAADMLHGPSDANDVPFAIVS